MKQSAWFETTMLALVLVAAVCGSLANGPSRHRGAQQSQAQAPASEQPHRLASGS